MAAPRADATVGVDWVVGGARADAPLAERTAWLEHLSAWVSSGVDSGEGSATPATRLRFLLQVLERNPERQAEIARLLRDTLREMDAVALLCETGLPRAHAFLHELFERMAAKVFPAVPPPNDLAALFGRLFPRESDGDWIAALPPATLAGIASLVASGDGASGPPRPLQDAGDALAILASHVQAIGMSHRVRRRTARERPLDSPFATLSSAVNDYLETPAGTPVVIGHGLPPFIEGLAASLNYALSFVLIHFLHGTLATKQPAMTAATMADHLRAAHERGRMRAFVAEVANLVRTQVAAIAGNLLLVVPAALLVQGLLLALGADHLPDREHALHYVESLSVLGATPLYAAITGVLLWLSALCAGWFENWAAYRRLPEAIATSPRMIRWFGGERAPRVAEVLDGNVAALGGNVSLGFLLGMVPVIAPFFGIPLEVRHVTLSTGQLALAAWAHGAAVFALPAFWLAVVGIGVIGFMNLTVSFALAMWVAIRSTGRGAVSRRRLVRAVLAHLVASPRDFLLPPRRAA